MTHEPARYRLRPASADDEPFLREMLYQALFVEPGAEPHPPDVLERPHIARYVKNWGRAGDLGFVAVASDASGTAQPVGAVWCRLSTDDDKGFAYTDDATPELGVALLPEHRGRGLGTMLLKHLLAQARGRYPRVSLSVSPNNPALRLYQRLGFKTVELRGTHHVMIHDLAP